MDVSSRLKNHGTYAWVGYDDNSKSRRGIIPWSGLYARIIGKRIKSWDNLQMYIFLKTTESTI